MLEHGELECQAVGIGSLAGWRDRRPRRAGPFAPRKQAVLRDVHEQDGHVFVRGRFPLAALLGWTGTSDLIALLEASPTCREVARQKTASLEFDGSGKQALWLVAPEGRCPLLGIVRPAGAPRG